MLQNISYLLALMAISHDKVGFVLHVGSPAKIELQKRGNMAGVRHWGSLLCKANIGHPTGR